jgi:hypothetical protein
MTQGPYAVLYPALAEAARRAGAEAIGLIEVSTAAALDVDRVGITYSDGLTLGDPASPVQVTCKLVGDRAVPARPLPPVVARAGAAEDLAGAIAAVPADALPVVVTTWTLSRLPPERRLRFLQALDAGRRVAWVSAEGVGVAPAVPTLGDRRASGHSIVGIAVSDGSTLQVEAAARCWSRGRWLAWLTGSA